ncbi:hypothetical protein QQ020_27355 [Fulvivirgaceae bacterium BMA12]|uniref:Uncharacterized protein n=1 Tax=Agaribacillus aureus TaxID=3051825 RepID=A0ABT8LHJ2_9BACT|nr:hypothetical protein [Fulvivirgaceae bacterium BMA12]
MSAHTLIQGICTHLTGSFNRDTRIQSWFQQINTWLKLAKAKIPVWHVYEDADRTIPYQESTLLLAGP